LHYSACNAAFFSIFFLRLGWVAGAGSLVSFSAVGHCFSLHYVCAVKLILMKMFTAIFNGLVLTQGKRATAKMRR
jgi:hypothetical protein